MQPWPCCPTISIVHNFSIQSILYRTICRIVGFALLLRVLRVHITRSIQHRCLRHLPFKKKTRFQLCLEPRTFNTQSVLFSSLYQYYHLSHITWAWLSVWFQNLQKTLVRSHKLTQHANTVLSLVSSRTVCPHGGGPPVSGWDCRRRWVTRTLQFS